MRIVLAALTLAGVLIAGGADQAAALLKKGESKRAADAARKLTQKDARNVAAWLVLADASIQLGEPADAWDALETALEANPTDARLSLKLGDTFIKMAEREQATSGDGTAITNYYLDAERMYDEALARNPKLADAMYGKAHANYFLARTEKARKYAADCLALDKDFARAHALQGHLFYGEKKYAEAAIKYEVVLKLNRTDPQICVRYGHTFIARGDREKAKAAYIDAIRRHPDDTQLAINSGLLNLAGKNWRMMAPLLKEAAEQVKNSASTWYYYGYSLFVTDRWGESAAAFRKARDLDPKNSNHHYFLGYAMEKEGDAKEALSCYRAALEANPDNGDAAGRFVGIIRMLQSIDAVEPLFEELLELAPSNGWVRNDYALILRDWAERRGADKMTNPPAAVKRRIRRSGEIYEAAAKLLPDEPQIQSDTGLLFEYYPCNRDDGKAADYFTRALRVGEYTYRDAFFGLDRLCRRTGDWEQLKDYAEGVLGALEDQGKDAVAPVRGRAPTALKHETPKMIARARAAIRDAEAHLKGK